MKDHNNFITVVLNKINLAKNFHQRVALSITSKSILHGVTLKFYLRRRYKELYLYIRMQGKFGNVAERHNVFKDFIKLVPDLILEGKQGHYTGFILHITDSTNDSLIYLLKLISLLSRPTDFYTKTTKLYRSFYNYPEKSNIPIHIRLTLNNFNELSSTSIKEVLTGVKEKCIKQ